MLEKHGRGSHRQYRTWSLQALRKHRRPIEVVVVGAGAAGLYTALIAARARRDG